MHTPCTHRYLCAHTPMCTHLCMYIYTCTHIYTHTHLYAHSCVHTHLCMLVIHTYLYMQYTCSCASAHAHTHIHASSFYFSEVTANSEQTQVRCVLTKSGYSWSHLFSTLPKEREPGRNHTLRKKTMVLSTPVKEPCGVGTGSRELGGCTRLVIMGLLSRLSCCSFPACCLLQSLPS